MDIDRARRFLTDNHRAVLATYYGDGRVQLSPVLVAVDDAGRALVSTREPAVKVRNVLRDPRVALCVMADAFFGEWIQLEGEAEVVRLPEAMKPLIDYYRRISGEHPNWDEYRAAMERERRVLLRIAITRVGPNTHG
ncbi:MAG: PPOX class F420-dependent oxidoreductase [Actinobacteria bacterium]|jgi:PPOX class probable F420-dependent enzyme|nr:MAG: PPOX class F420-dependent oxidoreductase [Actinomycetota bacterium]